MQRPSQSDGWPSRIRSQRIQDSATRIDPDPAATAADASRALQARAQQSMNAPEADWFDEKGTELKDSPVVPTPSLAELDQPSEEISLFPEESLSLDTSEESLETDLGLQGTFPPRGAESTLGFVSTPQAPAGATVSDLPPPAGTTLPPVVGRTDPPEPAKPPTPAASKPSLKRFREPAHHRPAHLPGFRLQHHRPGRLHSTPPCRMFLKTGTRALSPLALARRRPPAPPAWPLPASW